MDEACACVFARIVKRWASSKASLPKSYSLRVLDQMWDATTRVVELPWSQLGGITIYSLYICIGSSILYKSLHQSKNEKAFWMLCFRPPLTEFRILDDRQPLYYFALVFQVLCAESSI